MSFAALKGWFWSVLQQLGFANREATLGLLGLDNAGKTTLQYRLKSGNVQDFVPTQRMKEEVFAVGGVTVRTCDVGGHAAARYLWKRFSTQADGIVFMVDASDSERLVEARQELLGLLDDPVVAGTPLIVLANKCDLPEALSREDLVRGLGIDDQVRLYRCSVVSGTGYVEGFRWLAEASAK